MGHMPLRTVSPFCARSARGRCGACECRGAQAALPRQHGPHAAPPCTAALACMRPPSFTWLLSPAQSPTMAMRPHCGRQAGGRAGGRRAAGSVAPGSFRQGATRGRLATAAAGAAAQRCARRRCRGARHAAVQAAPCARSRSFRSAPAGGGSRPVAWCGGGGQETRSRGEGCGSRTETSVRPWQCCLHSTARAAAAGGLWRSCALEPPTTSALSVSRLSARSTWRGGGVGA